MFPEIAVLSTRSEQKYISGMFSQKKRALILVAGQRSGYLSVFKENLLLHYNPLMKKT